MSDKRWLTLENRIAIEEMYLRARPVQEIARKLGMNPSTIYKELKRGETGNMDKNGRCEYSAQLAQQLVFENRKNIRKPRAKKEEVLA